MKNTLEITSLFTRALTEILAKVSGFTLEPVQAPPDAPISSVAGVIHLNGAGDLPGSTLIISASDGDARVLCSYMTGAAQNAFSRDDLGDALCEIANMLAGNVKLLTGASFSPSTPYAIFGEGMSVSTKRRIGIIQLHLACDALSVKLKVILGG